MKKRQTSEVHKKNVEILEKWSFDDFLEVKIGGTEDFLKIRETLTRMGLNPNGTKNLVQSCHILQSRGDHFICHFKELLWLDGRDVDFRPEDIRRRNLTATLLEDWGMLEIISPKPLVFGTRTKSKITIVKKSEEDLWNFKQKYSFTPRMR